MQRATSRLRCLTFGCLILASNLLFAQRGKVAKDLQQVSSAQWVNVIVQYRVPPTQTHFSRVVAKGGSLAEKIGRASCRERVWIPV